MPQNRAPVAVIYACVLVTAALIVALMAYSGMVDGLLDALVEIVKDILKFFSQ